MFFDPHRMYRLRDMSSTPKNTMMKSLAEAIEHHPGRKKKQQAVILSEICMLDLNVFKGN